MPRELHASVLRGTEEGSKTYGFDDHQTLREPVTYFFQESQEGVILFIVFRTPPCRHSKCTFCPLPQTSTMRQVAFWHYGEQMEAVFRDPIVRARLHEIRKVIVSNQGSVLDEETFPTLVLMHLVYLCQRNIQGFLSLSLETRPEYVDRVELDVLYRAMCEVDHRISIELAIGYEAHDDHVRNDLLKKGLVLRGHGPHTLESLARKCAEREFGLKCYFMLKPWPTFTDKTAIEDVKGGIDFLDEMAREHGVRISMHLNPTFVGKGTALVPPFEAGQFVPPHLVDVARAALHAEGKRVSIFLGLNDEDMAVPGGSFLREGDEPIVDLLEQFNRTQDFGLLRAALYAAT
ncbi:MAG: hypothetical protein WC654_03685 [Patescibacteria group bacterium]